MDTTDTAIILATIAFAAFSHASFQLSTSVLTLMSGHALGRKSSHLKLMKLVASFILGAGFTVMLLLATLSFVLDRLLEGTVPALFWAITTGLTIGVGLSVWLFYYRRSKSGTALWVPRSFARFLNNRTKNTSHTAEAFSLGFAGIVSELLFTFAPLVITSLLLLRLDPLWQIFGLVLYAGVAVLPLLIVGVMVGGGHRLSSIQKWRETNKRFLQFIAGGILIVLGAFVYVDYVLAEAAATIGTLQ